MVMVLSFLKETRSLDEINRAASLCMQSNVIVFNSSLVTLTYSHPFLVMENADSSQYIHFYYRKSILLHTIIQFNATLVLIRSRHISFCTLNPSQWWNFAEKQCFH